MVTLLYLGNQGGFMSVKGKAIISYIIIMNLSSFANISQTLAKDHRNVDNCIELKQAGIPRDQWNAVNRTGQQLYEDMLSGQLERNNLTSEGTQTVRPSQTN